MGRAHPAAPRRALSSVFAVVALFAVVAAATFAAFGQPTAAKAAGGVATTDARATVGGGSLGRPGRAPAERRAEPAVDPSGPAVTLTAPALSSTASATARFSVSWSAAPALPSAGFDAYRVEYREPGVDYWLVWQRATAARSATFAAQGGRAYEFRAAATKTADPSVVGPWSPVRPVAVPADDAAFAVTRKWTSAKATGAYLSKVRSCATKGATATYRFKGSKAVLIAPRGRAYGKVAAYVRSLTGGSWSAFKLVKTVDLYSTSARSRVATSVATFPSVVEQREVKFVVTGTKNRRSTSARVALDGLAAYGAPHATGDYWISFTPREPSVVITEQVRLSATIPGCLDQGVEWAAYRIDRHGDWHADGAGSITADGLYTAPALPSNDVAGAGDDYRRYVVTAVGTANPDRLFGSVAVDVTPGPAPVVTGISPASGPPGSTVQIGGRHFDAHGGPLEVRIGGRSATVTSRTDTSVTAVVPGDWQTWQTSLPVYVWVSTWGRDSDAVSFTVTGLKPMPPSPWYLNWAGTDDDNASVGDTLRIYGRGFAPAAADNRVRFGGGGVATASEFTPDAYDPEVGTLSVVVPAGATSGPLAFQRVDGDGRWSAEDLTLEVRPATVVTAGLHPSFNGFVTAPQLVSNGTWGNEEWLLQGSSFMKLRIADYSAATPGIFWLDIRRNGVTRTRIMRAVSDTVAVPHRWWGEQHMFPDEIFAGAQPGDTVELRVRGDELTNRYERSTGWFPVAIGERPWYGSLHSLPAASLQAWWGSSYTIAKGSWLRVTPGETQATQVLTAPGLWTGPLPLGADGVAVKLVPLMTRGTYTITNQTSGESTQLVVADVGRADGGLGYGGDTQTDLQTAGLKMRVDGSEITVPPGAFWSGDLTPQRQYFSLRVDHFPSPLEPWDPTLTDGGHVFSVNVSPTVTRLLQPITITIPFETTGRATTPFLGMWDPDSGLYYDFGVSPAQVDTVNRRITCVIPAGTYPSQSASRAPARGIVARDAAAPAATAAPAGIAAAPAGIAAAPAGIAAAPAGRSFNDSFRQVGAVSSKVATSGSGFVWQSPRDASWGIRVDAVTDSGSSSYVPPAKAQEVLDVAAATWENLVGMGWSEPEAMITVTVRDYGDPGVYQGSTTKGVFGQPWVYVNSRLAMGAKLDTAVSHEMAHVFQRQITTNISTKWIDEAVAEWVAWDTLGSGSDLKASFEAGCSFPTVAFPSGFWSGYSAEQAYGAGAFVIWLANEYGPATVLGIYDTLAYRPEYWHDAPATFQAATGRSVPQLVAEFAPDFWLQSYDPVRPYTWSSRMVERIAAYGGRTASLSMPADSSLGLAFSPADAFAASLAGKPMVARAPGLPPGAVIDVYRDTSGVAQPPVAPVKIGTLSSITPVLDLGVYAGGCYRLVAVTPSGAALTASVTVEAVHLASVSPTNVPKAGGSTVTLGGSGFGDQKGIVMVGPAIVSGAAVTSWTDTQIVFTMPNMGATTGAQAVEVRPVIGGHSNTVNLTVY